MADVTAALTPDERTALESAQRDPARRLGPFVVLRELGRGGMGQVLLAYDSRRGELVAVKTLLERATKTARARLEREAKLLGALDHPGIAKLHGAVFEGPGAPYLVMELVRGRPLSSLLDEDEKMEPRRAAALVAEISRAVGAAHACGVVHRDLKPQNVMIRDDGRAVVLDFGLARSEQGSTLELTRTGSIVGTLAYLAPEQIGEAKHADARADVYALGGILYTCLTGRVPFEGPAAAVLAMVHAAPAPAPSEHVPGLDPALDALVLRCLEKRPADRPADAVALARALDAWRAGKTSRRRRSRGVALGLVGAAAASVTMLAIAAFAPRGESLDPTTVPVAVGSAAPTAPQTAPQPGAAALPTPAGPTSEDVALARRLVERAYGMERDEDQEAAEALLTRALELAPGDAVALGQRGYHRFRRKKHREAVADFAECVRLEPGTLLHHYNLGQNLAGAGEHEAAIAAFEEGLARFPGDPMLLLGRAGARVALGRDAEAQADYEQVVRVAPGELEAHSELANVLFRRGDFSAAVAAYSDAIELAPRSAALWRNRAASLMEVGRAADAAKDLERALELEPNDAKTRANLRAVREGLAAKSSHAEAVQLVQAARKLTTDDRQDEAEALCTRAVELAPALAGAWGQRGYHRFRKRDYQGAVADYREAARLEPGWALHHYNLSFNLAAANDPAGALAALEQALTLDPTLRAKSRFEHADYLNRLDRVPEAIAALEELLATTPGDGRALGRIGYFHFRQKDHAAAVTYYTRAIAAAPDDPSHVVNRAFNLQELGRHEEALRDAERAVVLAPRLAAAWCARGTARLHTDDLPGAEQDLLRALELDPNHALSQRSLLEARQRLGR